MQLPLTFTPTPPVYIPGGHGDTEWPADIPHACTASSSSPVSVDAIKARAAIVAKHGKARGVSGEMPCPVCSSGTLHYSIAQANGHIHAACSTATCVRWME